MEGQKALLRLFEVREDENRPTKVGDTVPTEVGDTKSERTISYNYVRS